jgi:hypothetical protein
MAAQGDNLDMDALKSVVQRYVDENRSFYYSQIYSWFDLNLEGCLSPIDYPPIQELHTSGEFEFYFLWGCVENCSVHWKPSSSSISPLPPMNEWPVLAFDNEGYVGYEGQGREAIIRLIKCMEREVASQPPGQGADLGAFISDVIDALNLTQEEMAAVDINTPPQPPAYVQSMLAVLSERATM